jgi:Ser/Thr protein kinase RdoA (MazF antagonist)
MPGIFYIPRPSRLLDCARSRFRSFDVNLEAIRAVLQPYGLDLVGTPRNVPLGRRSNNVIINTAAGRKVLKRYRAKWQVATILYGHSILLRLADLDFLAPRVMRTQQDQTVVNHDGQNYALFDFMAGANYAASFVPRRHYLRLMTMAGQTLASFHRQLERFTPQGQHHLGFETYDSDRRRDAAWQSDRLPELKDKSRDLTEPEDKANGEWLLQHCDQVIDDLSRLDETLREVRLPRTIIHGDYGLHNLIFQPAGVAAPVDFELARLEWRLSDLILIMSRLDFASLRQFMAAYQGVYPLSAVERRWVPQVWRFRKLQAAIQYWSSRFEPGGVAHRLALAREAVNEADWAARHQEQIGQLLAAPGT